MDFSGFMRILGPEGWAACGGLWRPVARKCWPFKMIQCIRVSNHLNLDAKIRAVMDALMFGCWAGLEGIGGLQ